MSRVEVDFDLCQGHAECEMEAPHWFTVPSGSGAKVRARRGEVPDDLIDDVASAVKFCPARALRLSEK